MKLNHSEADRYVQGHTLDQQQDSIKTTWNWYMHMSDICFNTSCKKNNWKAKGENGNISKMA